MKRNTSCIFALLAMLAGGYAQASTINWWVSGLNVTGGNNSGVGISGTSYNGASSKGLIFTAGQTGQVIDTIGLRLIGVSPFNQSSTLNLTIASVNQGTNALTGVLATDNVSYTSPSGSNFATSVEYTFGPSFLSNIAQLNLTSGTKYAMTVWGANASIATLANSSTYQSGVYTGSETGGFTFVGLVTAGNITTSASYYLAIGKTQSGSVPEPSTMGLMLIGLAGMGFRRLRGQIVV
ncbi:MAG: PEP-CTERM sorting domain-containing protein [Candidatus Methylumidiphilus sp.]